MASRARPALRLGPVTLPAGWRDRVAEVVGPKGTATPLGPNTWKMAGGGRTVVLKAGPGSPDEADGLRQLAAVAGGPAVPEVRYVDAELLVTTYVAPGRRTTGHEESLGRALAVLHRTPCPQWGGGSSWIGACPVDASGWPEGAGFYGDRLAGLAARCGLERSVGRVVTRLPDLLPPGGPSLLHGDLWWGNVLFGEGGRAWLIDPSVHGGHPEEDLAMLGLFGPVPERLLGAYREARPLEPGWEERVELFQLYPLLVHTVLFGGGYRGRAAAVAKRYA